MVNNFDNYKYFIGKVWKNIGISKIVNGFKILVYYLGNFMFIEKGGNIINLFINIISNVCFVNNVFA